MSATAIDPQFVLEHAAHVRALARRLVFDGARAADLEQETWLAALRNTPREMTSPRGWLARIAQRRAVHDWRSDSRRAAREQAASRPEPVASPETILEREETRTELVHAVLALDDPYRSALVGQFLEERPPREAARRRGVPVETQRTHVKRGLEILRERLKRGHGAAFGAFQLALVRDLQLEAPWGTTFAAAGSTIAIGGLSMWTVRNVVVAGAVVAALVLIATRPWDSLDVPSPSMAQDSTADLVAPATEVAPPEDATQRLALAETTDLVGMRPASPRGSSKAEVVVRARVLDESARPIQGAHAVLRAKNGAWAAAFTGETRFQSESDASGVVRIEAPVPTASEIVLEVDAGPFRTRGQVDFDSTSMRALQAGETDAGELVLRPAGQVSGRVVADGSALADVRVEDANSYPGRTTRVRSDSDGRFLLGHVAPGPGRLLFVRDAFIPRHVAIDALAGQIADLGDVSIDRAPSIQGHIVDQNGAPLSGVSVRAQAVRGSRNGRAFSEVDGSFRIDFMETGTYDLEIPHDPRFKVWGGRDVRGARFSTGDPDVRIVLEHAPKTTFVITDATTGSRLSDFGMAVRRLESRDPRLRGMMFDEDWPPAVRTENGEVEWPAEPGVDEVFVTAPGHAPLRTPVVHDDPDRAFQTLKLERGSTLRGRLLRGGQSLSSAHVGLERAVTASGPAPGVPERLKMVADSWDLEAFVGHPRQSVASEDGSFSFEGLAPGTYKLIVATQGAIVHTIQPLAIGALEERDLGDLAIARGATLRGRVDTGSASPSGWNVVVTGSRALVIDREDGQFEFTGLAAGKVEVEWYFEGAFGLEGGYRTGQTERKLALVLTEGEVREVVLDARAVAPALLTARVRSGGEPAADVALGVALKSEDGSSVSETLSISTDARGLWSGRVRPGREVRLLVRGPERQLLAASEALVLTPGETREVELDVSTGDVEIVLPDSLRIPDSAGIVFGMAPAGEGSSFPSYWSHNPPTEMRNTGRWDGARRLVVKAGAGNWEVTVQVFALEREEAKTQQVPLTPRIERRITIRAGETTTVEVP